MEYNFGAIEKKWRQIWKERETYAVSNYSEKPKFYVLDMFPYPSGAGLHVGHPLGYIASDILARFKRMQGFNVLHPMGFDAFGLPAEQYALETGQHPAKTTEVNIARYKEQLDNIGFSYDWGREVRTSDPNYYKWTQWIFLQLFHAWYDRKLNKARPISELIALFEKSGNNTAPSPADRTLKFDKGQWKDFSETRKREVLMGYRLAYLDYADVWWCEALGTVLANDEVINGVSERGGHPCVRKKMRQWALRITEYADRLLDSLDGLAWSEAMKDMQRNWIGKSQGAEVEFVVENGAKISVFTTRPDTIFGVDFLVLAPEHELVGRITTSDRQEDVAKYKEYTQNRSERERMTEVKEVTGCFTGAYAVHPFTRKNIPIYIADYVLAGYGTGAIMAVPSGDERDHAFAKKMEIPVTNIFGALYTGEEAYTAKDAVLENSEFLNGLTVQKAAEVVIRAIEDAGVGCARIAYKLRDAGFSRQRYWGEPFPIVYVGDVPYAIDEKDISCPEPERCLPVELPMVESYKPGPEGEGPLANVTDWVSTTAGRRETNTMPGYAGSSWYFLRYADPHNSEEFASREVTDYWGQVDVYVGGTEHAVGHLLYSRMWTKVLYDLGHIGFEEPFKRLVNQGMIQGSSRMVYRRSFTWGAIHSGYPEEADSEIDAMLEEQGKIRPVIYVSKGIYDRFKSQTLTTEDRQLIHQAEAKVHSIMKEQNLAGEFEFGELCIGPLKVEVECVDNDVLDKELFRTKSRLGNKNSILIDEPGGDKYICGTEVEKMSKSKYNVVNPDDIVSKYGADTFRLYEMFLGPIEASKPWDTKGIEGVHRFLRKAWRLYVSESGEWLPNEEPATDAQLRAIHKCIQKVGDDIERFSFNTAVSAFMICVNELSASKCRNADVLRALAIILCPFAPHLSEELWQRFGHESSAVEAPWPAADQRYLVEDTKLYPIAINGKTRTELAFPLIAEQAEIETAVLADATVQKWLEGKAPKKVVYVKGRMINVVV